MTEGQKKIKLYRDFYSRIYGMLVIQEVNRVKENRRRRLLERKKAARERFLLEMAISDFDNQF